MTQRVLLISILKQLFTMSWYYIIGLVKCQGTDREVPKVSKVPKVPKVSKGEKKAFGIPEGDLPIRGELLVHLVPL